MAHTSLCQLARDWRGSIPAGGLMVEQKHDGWRCLYFRGIDGKARLWTRQGVPLEGVAHIAYRLDLMERAAGVPMVFDGEFVVDGEGGTLAATKAWAERGWKYGGEAGVFHAFDCLTQAEWRAGGSDMPLYARKRRLADLAAGAADPWEWRPGSRGRDEGATPVVVVPDEWAFGTADVLAAARRIWAAGGEGVMLKNAEAPYRRNRNAAWQKVKRENADKWTLAA